MEMAAGKKRMKKLILFGIVFVLLAVNIYGESEYNYFNVILGGSSYDGAVVERQVGNIDAPLPVTIQFFDVNDEFITETRADSSGKFKVFLPSRIDAYRIRIVLPREYDTFIDESSGFNLKYVFIKLDNIQQSTGSQQPTTPIFLDKFIENKDFDKILVRLTSVDQDLMGSKFDLNRITFVGSVEYYLTPLIQKLENNQDFVNIKSNSIVEFWKNNKKIDQKTLVYDNSIMLRQNCAYYIFNNKNNDKVHFDVCKTVEQKIATYQPLSRENVNTGEFASLDEKAVPVELVYPDGVLKNTDCVDSRSVVPGVESFIGVIGENWCKDKSGFYLNKLCNQGKCDSFDGVASSALCSELNDDNLNNINVDGVAEITGDEVLTDEIDAVGIVTVEPDDTQVNEETFAQKVERARKELEENGITSEQERAYFVGISESLYGGVIPFGPGENSPLDDGFISN